MASDSVLSHYLDAWARLSCQSRRGSRKPNGGSRSTMAGDFSTAGGEQAAALGWTPGDLFGVTSGLVWRLVGEPVETLGADHARLADGRAIMRGEERK